MQIHLGGGTIQRDEVDDDAGVMIDVPARNDLISSGAVRICLSILVASPFQEPRFIGIWLRSKRAFWRPLASEAWSRRVCHTRTPADPSSSAQARATRFQVSLLSLSAARSGRRRARCRRRARHRLGGRDVGATHDEGGSLSRDETAEPNEASGVPEETSLACRRIPTGRVRADDTVR